MDNGVLYSTKSIDTGAASYKTPSRLKSRLNSYMKQLDNFEKKCPKVYDSKGFSWGGGNPLRYSSYNGNKVLELVLPDIPLSAVQKEVIETFMETNPNVIIVIMK